MADNKTIEITSKQLQELNMLRKDNVSPVGLMNTLPGTFSIGYPELKYFTGDELARLLYQPDCYKMVTEYKVGDWVLYLGVNTFAVQIETIENVVDNQFTFNSRKYSSSSILRLATKEEIKHEKLERIWWSIRREQGEFKEGDAGIHENGHIVREKAKLEKAYVAGNIVGLYPAESLVNFKLEDN